MKIYKFRGLAHEDVGGKKINPPKMVYGNLLTNIEGDYTMIRAFHDERGLTETYIVKPESVALFIGYDRNNEEVYDNDKLIEDEQSAFNGTEDVNDVAVDADVALETWDFGGKFLSFELVKE